MKYLPLAGVKKNRTDFEKLQEDYWYYLPVPQRESLIVKIFANYMSEDIRLNTTLFFVKEDEDPQMNGSNGYYNHAERIICINERLLHLNQGLMVYSVLAHELVHVSQNYIVDHAEKFPDKKEEIELLNIYLNGTDRKINFCDMKDADANFHITNFYIQSNISNIFYYLNISERQAYIKQNAIYCKKDILSEIYLLFNQEYGTSLSAENINTIIDVCFCKLYNHQVPSGTYEEKNLQATIMYDIGSISNYLSDLSNNAPYYVDKDKKKKDLAKYGYTIYREEPVNNLMNSLYLFVSGKRSISDLTVEEQRVNPKVILLSLFNKKACVEDLKDKEAFIYEIENVYSSLSGEIKEFVSDSLIEDIKLKNEEILQNDI